MKFDQKPIGNEKSFCTHLETQIKRAHVQSIGLQRLYALEHTTSYWISFRYSENFLEHCLTLKSGVFLERVNIFKDGFVQSFKNVKTV